ncbi:MAG: HAD-IA family hydrolase [Oceanicaulis sp.]
MAPDFSSLNGARLAFDLDGTLVDTAPDLVRALNAAVVPEGLEPIPIAAVRAMVGRGARALIERAYERAGALALSARELDVRLDRFMDAYRSGIADQSRPFDGVVDALDVFAANGAELSVCTNKPTHLAVALLDTLNLSNRFVRIIGPEDARAKKPDPRHLTAAIGGEADERAVLIGDSEPDALAAKAAGAWCVLFEDGYSEKPVGALGADRLFKRWSELPAIVAELLGSS